MAQLKRILKKNPEMPIAKIAKLLEVDRRTVYRDIDHLKKTASKDSNYSDVDGLKFEGDVTYTDVEITESEMLAMMVAKKDLKNRRAAGLDRGITSTFKKIVSTASSKLVSKIKNWERVISFRMTGHAKTDPKIFDAVVRATDKCEQMRIDYRDADGKETTREIDLLHVANINGDWYAFARDWYRKGQERCFNLCRIKKFEFLGKTFEFPKGWTLTKYLGKSFGVRAGDPDGKEYQVVMRFRGRVADFVREKDWRCQDKLIELGNGVVEVHFTVNGLFEIFLWTLNWGRGAKVVSPPELRCMVEQEIKAMEAAYADDSW